MVVAASRSLAGAGWRRSLVGCVKHYATRRSRPAGAPRRLAAATEGGEQREMLVQSTGDADDTTLLFVWMFAR
jgi:hypothetical protein